MRHYPLEDGAGGRVVQTVDSGLSVGRGAEMASLAELTFDVAIVRVISRWTLCRGGGS